MAISPMALALFSQSVHRASTMLFLTILPASPSYQRLMRLVDLVGLSKKGPCNKVTMLWVTSAAVTLKETLVGSLRAPSCPVSQPIL